MYKKTTVAPNIPATTVRILENQQVVSKINNLRPYPGDSRYVTGDKEISTPTEAAAAWTSLLNQTKALPIPLLGTFVTESGSKPDKEVHMFHGKFKAKSDNFTKECRNGIIVKHPYTAYTGVVRAGERWESLSIGDTIYPKVLTQPSVTSGLLQYGLMSEPKLRIRPYVRWPIISQFVWADGMTNNGARDVVVTTEEETVTVYPLDAGVRDQFEDLCLRSLNLMDDAIITDTLAKANDKELDILTTIAEMPKTIKSVIDGLKLMTEMAKAAKKRELQITKSYERLKKNHMKLAYRKFLHEQRARKKGRTPSKVSSFDDWAKTNESKFGSETAIEIIDAIQGVWMNYRYNIRPLVYTMQDAVSATERYAKTYITARSKVIKELTMPEMEGHHFVGTATITHRCWIKRRYDVSDAIKNLNNVLMADIFVTAYELIPIWSIVTDWFFNVGNALRALPFKSFNYLEQAATYSVKVEIDGRYVNDLDPTRFNEVEFTGYKRQIISPNSHITVKYVNEFDNLKALDALSFAWPSIRKPIRNLPYKRKST